VLPPAIDYGPELNHIADLLQQRPTPATPATPPGPDPTCMAAITQVGNQVSQQGQQIQSITNSVQAQGQQIGQLTAGLSDVAKQTKDIGENVAKHGTLLERFNANKEADLAANPNESKLKADLDAAKETLSLHGHGFLFVLGTLAAVGVVAWGVIHLVANLQQAAAKTAAANPNDPLAQLNSQVLTTLNNLNQGLAAIPNAIVAAISPGIAATVPAAAPAAAAAGIAAATAAAHSAAGAVQAVQSQVNTLAQSVHATALATPAPSQTQNTSTAATSPPAVVNVTTAPAASAAKGS
jgi:hypothetical protein